MKTFLKFPLCLALGAMMGMSMTSCSDNDDPTDGTELSAQEKALKEVVADFADKTVIPSYQGMADAAMSLHSLCIDIRTKKQAGTLTTADVEAACEAWKLARDYWEKSEAWLFGPAGDYNVDPHIDSWPLDKTGMDALLNNPAQMAQMDDEGNYVGNYLGYALQGFHAIEYLLFELTNTNASGNATANSTSVAHNLNYTTEELNYLVGLAGDLRNQCILLEACWAGTENVSAEKQQILTDTELDKGKNFGDNIKNAGAAGSEYKNYLDVVYDMITAGIQNIANEVGNIKIGNHGQGTSLGRHGVRPQLHRVALQLELHPRLPRQCHQHPQCLSGLALGGRYHPDGHPHPEHLRRHAQCRSGHPCEGRHPRRLRQDKPDG